MSKKPESRRQLIIRKTLEREVGGWWTKIHGNEFQRSGLPDLIGCACGLFFGFEVKEPGEKPTELQSYEIEKINKAGGGVAAVVNTADEALALVVEAIAQAARSRSVHPRSHRR